MLGEEGQREGQERRDKRGVRDLSIRPPNELREVHRSTLIVPDASMARVRHPHKIVSLISGSQWVGGFDTPSPNFMLEGNSRFLGSCFTPTLKKKMQFEKRKSF